MKTVINIGLPWLLLGFAALSQVLEAWNIPREVYAALALALLVMNVIYFVLTSVYEYRE